MVTRRLRMAPAVTTLLTWLLFIAGWISVGTLVALTATALAGQIALVCHSAWRAWRSPRSPIHILGVGPEHPAGAPVRPSGVRIVRRNGQVIPIELAYAGETEDGIHQWASPTRFDPGSEVLEIAMLPPRNAIVFGEGGEE